MKYAVIAAGEGSRLAGEGIAVPKPLVRIGGECLIDRLIRVFMNNGATEIVVICNGTAIPVSRHLEHISNEGFGRTSRTITLCGKKHVRFHAQFL